MSDDYLARRRPDQTYSKHIFLTEFGREKIMAWAQTHNLNFSAAIETLALMGLDDTRADYAIPALRATTLQGIRLAFNRIARLLSDVAIESAASRTLTEGILLQLVREEAEANPDDFDTAMLVPRGDDNRLHGRIRAFHDDIRASAEQAALKRLKRAVSRVQELFAEDETEV
jgi:hypothetical protein